MIRGLYFVIILILEKKVYGKFIEKTKVFKYVYTLILIILSFTIFNGNSLNEVITFLKNMLFLKDIPFISFETLYHIRNYITVIIIAIISSTPVLKLLTNKIKNNKICSILEICYYFTLLIIITAFLIDSSFNPFLYFRF